MTKVLFFRTRDPLMGACVIIGDFGVYVRVCNDCACGCMMIVRVGLCCWELRWERNDQAKVLFFDWNDPLRYDRVIIVDIYKCLYNIDNILSCVYLSRVFSLVYRQGGMSKRMKIYVDTSVDEVARVGR